VLDLVGIGVVVPHESTIRRLLQRLDPDAVEAALSVLVAAQLADRAAEARTAEAGVPERERRRVWALDGKTLRGARDGHGGQTHLVSVLDQATGAVLAQVAVDAKSGELAVIPELLAGLDLQTSPPGYATTPVRSPTTGHLQDHVTTCRGPDLLCPPVC
jgi:hypothetical protein